MSGCKSRNSRTGSRAPAGLARLGLALLALAAVSGCHHRGRAACESSELRVGIATVYKPLAFKEGGQIVGVEADFAHRLSEDLKVKVTQVELPWNDLIPALVDGRIDVIMSGMSITEDRSKLVSFTQPYLRVGQMALVRRSDSLKLHDPKMMRAPTSRIGFHNGTTGEAFVRGKLISATPVGFDSPEAGIAALRAGEIDYFIHDAPTIWRISGGLEHRDPDLRGFHRPLTEEYLAWAVRKDDTALRDRLNETLVHWQTTGETEAVLDRWIPVRKISVDAKPSR